MAELLANEHVVTLETIGHGAALELFNKELRNVLDNIADPNTEPKGKRKISLEITFAPTVNRDMGQVLIDCKAKLMPHRGEATTVFFAYVAGQRAAVEPDPKQGALFDKPDGKVQPMARKGE